MGAADRPPDSAEARDHKPLDDTKPPADGGDQRLPGNLREFVPYALGFLVFFAVGMAPFLGTADIPGFKALLTLIPANLRDTAIPISASLMGVIGAGVQRLAVSRPSQVWLKREFSKAWKLALGAMAVLAALYTFVVVPVEVRQPKIETFYVQVGFYRPVNANCPAAMSDAMCLTKQTTLDRARIDGHWGDFNVRSAGLSLQIAYWASTGLLAWLVGLVYIGHKIAPPKRPG